MASESTGDVSLPADLTAWLDDRAAALDVERDELVAQLVGAYRVAAEADGEGPAGEWLDERVEKRLDSFEADLERDLDEIRRRVVQVRNATEQRAAADHDHEEFERLDAVERRLDDLEAAVDRLPDDDGDGGDGGDGAADLAARLDTLESRLARVARAVVALQRDRQGAAGTGDRLADVKRAAAREGITEAECAACEESVALSVLPAPTCPHCGAAIDGVTDGDGMFGSPRLTTDGSGTDE